MGAYRKFSNEISGTNGVGNSSSNQDAIVTLYETVLGGKYGSKSSLEETAADNNLHAHRLNAEHLAKKAERLAQLKNCLSMVINQLSIGVCILDHECKIIQSNHEFDRQMRNHKAFRIGPDQKLAIGTVQERSRVSELLEDAVCTGRPCKEMLRVAGRDTWSSVLRLDIVPLDQDDLAGFADGGAILYSMDSNRLTGLCVEPLAKMYGLTPTEAGLVEMICDGMTNAQIAKRRGRSVDTINAQVKSVLAKTRSANRTKLVRLSANFGTDFLAR